MNRFVHGSNADGRAVTNTITRAELVAILVALQEMKDTRMHETIATDSQATISVIHKHLYEIHEHAEKRHKALLQRIVAILLHRAAAGVVTTFLLVNSYIGTAGNEAAGKLAGEATDNSKCDQVISVGRKGLPDHFWPCKTVQAAIQDHAAVTWQVGNLSHDVKKTEPTPPHNLQNLVSQRRYMERYDCMTPRGRIKVR